MFLWKIPAEAGTTCQDAFSDNMKVNVLKLTSLVDKRLAEGLEDIRKGRVKGPFNTVKDLIAFLNSPKARRG